MTDGTDYSVVILVMEQKYGVSAGNKPNNSGRLKTTGADAHRLSVGCHTVPLPVSHSRCQGSTGARVHGAYCVHSKAGNKGKHE